MAGIPGALDLLRVELQETQAQLEALMVSLEAVAFERRTFEEMLCAVVREHGECTGDFRYEVKITREGLAFSNKPFVSGLIPDLEIGGMTLRFKGGPEVAEALAEHEAHAQAEERAAEARAGFTLVGADGKAPEKG